MAFSLPPIKDLGMNIPSFSVEELASLPSTSLTSLANNMASIQTELNVKNSQLETRANKLSGKSIAPLSTNGRNMIDTTVSLDKVDTSIAATINPVASTANEFKGISDKGASPISNLLAAGTTEAAANSVADKISEFSRGGF